MARHDDLNWSAGIDGFRRPIWSIPKEVSPTPNCGTLSPILNWHDWGSCSHQAGNANDRAIRSCSKQTEDSNIAFYLRGTFEIAIFIAEQDGQDRRIESVGFGDFEIAATRIRKRTVEAVALEDRVARDAPWSARAGAGHWKRGEKAVPSFPAGSHEAP